MNCKKCGSELKDGQKFCVKCGTKVVFDETVKMFSAGNENNDETVKMFSAGNENNDETVKMFSAGNENNDGNSNSKKNDTETFDDKLLISNVNEKNNDNKKMCFSKIIRIMSIIEIVAILVFKVYWENFGRYVSIIDYIREGYYRYHMPEISIAVVCMILILASAVLSWLKINNRTITKLAIILHCIAVFGLIYLGNLIGPLRWGYYWDCLLIDCGVIIFVCFTIALQFIELMMDVKNNKRQ